MTIRDLILNCVEIQGKCHYCYYDNENERRIEISAEEAMDYDMKYIYCEDGELYIEVDKED